MNFRFKNIQLVFCSHSMGKLAYSNEIQIQPPLGIITIGSYLKKHLPEINIEVIDGKLLAEKEVLDRVDSEIVGFSVWYSNYENTIKTIQKLKSIKPWVKIAIGGPHTSFLATRIIRNNNEIDFVFIGEAEISFYNLISNKPLENISGLLYRNKTGIICENFNTTTNVDLNHVPVPDLNLLYPEYKWQGNKDSHAMTAFPFSGIRGCTRKERCEYCSIPLTGYRVKKPEKYWQEIKFLNEQFGINYFFETGDVTTIKYLRELAAFTNYPDIAFRIYAYPGQLKTEHISILKKVGVKTIFMGIESVLVWNGSFKRKYNGYSLDFITNVIHSFVQEGIKTIPSFIFGLEGEDHNSLIKNLAIIEELASIKNIDEITVSKILPLPGTEYFRKCLKNRKISDSYKLHTNSCLESIDRIDYQLLGELFIENYSQIGYQYIEKSINKIAPLIGKGLASWN